MKQETVIILVLFMALVACSTKTVELKNEKKGQLKASMTLEITQIKKIVLDSNTAPKPQYTQMFTDSTGQNYFTFLNKYSNAIHFYNYNSLALAKTLKYDKKGPNGILKPIGYHIKNLDSIYIYNKSLTEVVLTNDKSKVLKKISLQGTSHRDNWYTYYPQYYPKTVTPFIETSKELLLTGQSFVNIQDSLISKFKFNAHINYTSQKVHYSHIYPKELYGFNYNWIGDLYTTVYAELHPDENKLVFSFPVSHDIYIADLYGNSYKKKYAGSNEAGTISSIEKSPKQTSREVIYTHYASQYQYAAIKYDKYRKVYYRFLLKAIPNATEHSRPKDKPIAVIVMDKDFNYLGEVTLGTGKEWHWQNSFVTKEGLNIEYLDNDDIDEVALTLKIFNLKKL